MAKSFKPLQPETITAQPTGKRYGSTWDTAALAGPGMSIRNAFNRSPYHHLIPQELLKLDDIRDILIREKINIDDYAVQICEGEHSAIHSCKYNDEWIAFFRVTHINPSRSMILAQMRKMKRDFLIDGPVQPYVKS